LSEAILWLIAAHCLSPLLLLLSGRAAYLPIFLNEIPSLFRRGLYPVDVAMVQVSPPDVHGYCSLGKTFQNDYYIT